MSHVATMSVARQLGSLFEGGSAAGLSDRQLLERFTASGHDPAGESAFAAIVARHGPMVLGVCRQVLGDAQHAEDAFQAVFLVLARKAATIRDPDLLGNWLYGVAMRTARCARQQIARRRRREEGDAMRGLGAAPPTGSGPFAPAPAGPTAPPADRPAIDREQAEALHGEVERLPRAFRLPVVLCYFEGLTLDEAARRMRCPAGTLGSRLARAREKLRAGLARRGIVVPAAALAAMLTPRSASASIPPLLCQSTARAAIAFAAQSAASGGALSAPASAIAQEVLTTMTFHKLRLIMITALALAAAATGAGYLAFANSTREGEPPGEPKVKEARNPVGRGSPDPQPARMTVAGRVVDPDGKPIKGAVVDVMARPRKPWVGASDDAFEHALLGRAESDADGRYRLEAPRTSSTRVFEVHAIAVAPGYGIGWAELNPDAEQPTGPITLSPEQPVRARLVDVNGAPARGLTVHVLSLWRSKGGNGIWIVEGPPEGSRIWPKPLKTDDQGRISVPGLGAGVAARLQVRDIPYARQDIMIDTARDTPGQEVVRALKPARILEGRVLAEDTGRPIPNAVVSAATYVHDEYSNGIMTTKFRADDQGRFLINPIAGKMGYMNPDAEGLVLGAFPTGGEPYLIQQDEVPWTKGAVKATHDIKLKRGVLIRGKVTERGTGRPLADSSIQFIPTRGGDDILSGWQAIVASREDGSFQIAVAPGKGHLLVFGPTGDYVLQEIGFNQLHDGRPGGMRYRAHAILPYEVKAGDPPRELSAELRPGVTIRGRVEGPDGQTVTDAAILSTLRIEAFNPYWRGDYQIPVRDGRFELHGLDPRGSSRTHVLDAGHEWGATVEVSGKQADEDLTIRLQPCGTARGRIVGPDGRPVARYQPHLEFVATSGPSRFSRNEKDRAGLSADTDHLANVDRKHYWPGPTTDAEGRFTLPSLIPGALYRITDLSTASEMVRKDFTVRPGEMLDLGDLRIEKPQAP